MLFLQDFEGHVTLVRLLSPPVQGLFPGAAMPSVDDSSRFYGRYSYVQAEPDAYFCRTFFIVTFIQMIGTGHLPLMGEEDPKFLFIVINQI